MQKMKLGLGTLAFSLFMAPALSIFISTPAFAQNCAPLFSAPSATANVPGISHFVGAKEFLRAPASPSGQKAQGQIVLTSGVRDALLVNAPTEFRAFMVIQLGSLSKARFNSLMLLNYGITAKFGAEFVGGFQDARLSGPSPEILRFLQNGFARKNVFWVGRERGEKYVSSISSFLRDPGLSNSEVASNSVRHPLVDESLTSRHRAHGSDRGVGPSDTGRDGFNDRSATGSSGYENPSERGLDF